MPEADPAPDAVPLVVAVAQVELERGAVDENIASCSAAIAEAAAGRAQLVVLPECALTGYAFDDAVGARAASVPLDGVALGALRRQCSRHRIHCVVGLLERAGDRLHNTAVLIDDEGRLAGTYRKAHLPCLGADRFVEGGAAPPAVFATAIGRIAINICYDIRFPETARLAALAGADIVACPANWPVQARLLAEHFTVVRAAENRVVLAAANRGDSEDGTEFAGMSQIVAPGGEVLARAGREPAVLVAGVELTDARRKRTVHRPHVYETDVIADRRPELYAALAATEGGGT